MRKPTLAVVGLVAAAWAAVPVVAAITDDGQPAPPTATAVPDLVGDTSDTIRDQLENAGLTGTSARAGWNADHVVVSTNPPSGTSVARGSTVVIVEMERDEVEFFAKPMPDLTGVEWIKFGESDAGPAYPFFVQAAWRKPAAGETPGSIVEQIPKPGAALKLGEPVKVTVAEYQPGPDSGSYGNWDIDVDVPNVCRRTKWC